MKNKRKSKIDPLKTLQNAVFRRGDWQTYLPALYLLHYSAVARFKSEARRLTLSNRMKKIKEKYNFGKVYIFFEL